MRWPRLALAVGVAFSCGSPSQNVGAGNQSPPPTKSQAQPSQGFDATGTRHHCTRAESRIFDCAAGPDRQLADACRAQGKRVLSCRCDVLCAERLDGTFGLVPAVRNCSVLLSRGRKGFTSRGADASYRFVDPGADPAASCAGLGAPWSLITRAEMQHVQLELFRPTRIVGGRAVDSCIGDDCVGVTMSAGAGGCHTEVWTDDGGTPRLMSVQPSSAPSSARIAVCRRDVPRSPR